MLGLFVICLIIGGDICAAEELPQRDSSAFPHFFDGTALLEDADPAWLLTASGNGNESGMAGGVFHFSSSADDDADNYAFWVLPDVEWANFPRDIGFTLEVGLQPDPGKSLGINLAAAEDVGAGYAVLKVLENSVEWNQGDGDEMTTLNAENNSDGIHVFRIVKLPSIGGEPGFFNVYRDGVLLGEKLSGRYAFQNVPTNRLYIGDVGTWDSAGSIHFIRWDTSGAYEPEKK